MRHIFIANTIQKKNDKYLYCTRFYFIFNMLLFAMIVKYKFMLFKRHH